MTRDPVESHLRSGEAPLTDAHLLLRGSPLTAAKFAEHAARTARAYTYLGQPCFGVSVEMSTSDAETVRLLAGRRLSTRRQVALIAVGEAIELGFLFLPTFAAPNWTVVLAQSPTATVDALATLAAAHVIENPYYQSRREV